MSFFRKNKGRIIVVLIAIILIAIIGTTSGRDQATKSEKAIGGFFAPIGKNINKFFHGLSSNLKGIKSVGRLKRENKSLNERLVKLEAENRRYENIIGKSESLKKADELSKKTDYKLLGTSVIGKEPGNWFDRFTIDKGSKDGVKQGDILVQAYEMEDGTVVEGLVGRVAQVGDNWSKVITIIDELNNVAFKVLRTQDGGMLTGSPEGELSGYLFDDDSKIIKGDKLYTSGLGEKYRKDIYIGQVKKVNNDEAMVKIIEVEPAINFKKIYDLYIIMD